MSALAGVLAGLRFRLLGPDAAAGADGHFHLQRADGSVVTLIETEGCPLEAAVVHFGPDDERLRRLLAPLLAIPKMSTLAIGGIINQAVRAMDPASAYLNVGVWNGFTLLAGLAGNDDRACVGVDNFTEFGGPRDAFMDRFASCRGPLHEFHDRDYADYFGDGPGRSVGLYLYDGKHTYGHQLRGLKRAEPFLADDAVILVDDTNLERARDATLRFAEESPLGWTVTLDRGTASVRHPTLWNGLMALEAGGGGRLEWETEHSLAAALVQEGDPKPGRGVSVICVGQVDSEGLEAPGRVELLRVDEPAQIPGAIDGSAGSHLLIALPGCELSADQIEGAVKRAGREALRAKADRV